MNENKQYKWGLGVLNFFDDFQSAFSAFEDFCQRRRDLTLYC